MKNKKPKRRQSEERKLFLMSARNKRIALLCLGLCFCLTLVACLSAGLTLLLREPTETGRIAENVYVGGIHLGGMTQAEAKSALEEAIGQSYSLKNMTVALPSASLVLTPQQSGARLDLDAVVEAAYAYGRSGSNFERNLTQLRGRSHTIPLLPYLNLDLAAIRAAVDQFCEDYSVHITQPTATLQGQRPIYSADADMSTVVHQKLILTTGTPQFLLDSQDIYDAVLDAYSLFTLEFSYEVPNQVPPEALDLQAIFDAYCVEPQDAVLDANTFQLTPEVVGYGFDIAQVQLLVDDMGYGQELELPLQFLMPDITTEALTGHLFKDVLATYTSQCPDGFDANRNTNLKLSCQAINGLVLKEGESFDFNGILGPRTAEQGYLKAPTYSGSTTSTVGGGISQTASALHYCALLAELDIVEHASHRYLVNYTPVGTDAAITYGSQNLVFVNNTGSPIRILATADGSRVTITFMGTKTHPYTSFIESHRMAIVQPGTVYQSMSKDNVGGYKDGYIIQTALVGYTYQLHFVKKDASGNIVESRILYTVTYEKRDQIIVRIEDYDY